MYLCLGVCVCMEQEGDRILEKCGCFMTGNCEDEDDEVGSVAYVSRRTDELLKI